MIDTLLINISNSKLFSGCIMLMTNIGGKYLAQEMPSNIDKIFLNYIFLRYLVLFSIFFMATRDIKVSILLTLLFYIFVKYLFNEKSSFCILDKNDLISENEYLKAKKIMEKYNDQNK